MPRDPRPSVVTALRLSATGSRPFLCVASDHRRYWCKYPENPHGPVEVVNEVAASVIGGRMGKPVRPWRILDVPQDLVGTSVGSGIERVRLRDSPVFGSLELGRCTVEQEVNWTDRDDNARRLPLLFALWLLCNAEDIQVLLDFSDDLSVWSVDHGFWFGSFELPWGMGDPTDPAGRPELPSVRGTIPPEGWDAAAAAIDLLTPDLHREVGEAMPEEWGETARDCARLVDYVLSRRAYVLEELKRLREVHGRRRRR